MAKSSVNQVDIHTSQQEADCGPDHHDIASREDWDQRAEEKWIEAQEAMRHEGFPLGDSSTPAPLLKDGIYDALVERVTPVLRWKNGKDTLVAIRIAFTVHGPNVHNGSQKAQARLNLSWEEYSFLRTAATAILGRELTIEEMHDGLHSRDLEGNKCKVHAYDVRTHRKGERHALRVLQVLPFKA